MAHINKNVCDVNSQEKNFFCFVLIRPQFVDTLFIVTLRSNMLMRRAVIINY